MLAYKQNLVDWFANYKSNELFHMINNNKKSNKNKIL